MTTIGRELVAGSAAAVGFVALFVLSSMPWGLALGLASGLYAGLRFLLPVAPAPEQIVHEGGVTEAERRVLVQGGRQHLATLQTLAERLKPLQPALSADVTALGQVVTRLLARFEREPKSLRLAGLLPMYLETIARNLHRYVTLASESRGQATGRERLSATEGMVRAALAAFEQAWEQVEREDWFALEAEAETLKTLLESELM